MEDKTIKVDCSFCGKEIECPENMMKTEKHACFECFNKLKEEWSGEDFSKVHVDIPMDKMDKIMPEILMNTLINEVFPELWRERKNDLKEMSKKELAEAMFAAGAESIMNIVKETEKLDSEDKEKE